MLSSPNRFAALPRFVSALSKFEGAVTRRIALSLSNPARPWLFFLLVPSCSLRRAGDFALFTRGQRNFS
jgi:hypothetical protein